MHATSVQTQEVGDVDGHVVGVGRYSGLASFPDGSVGTANFTFTNDYIKGSGTYSTYYMVYPTATLIWSMPFLVGTWGWVWVIAVWRKRIQELCLRWPGAQPVPAAAVRSLQGL
jgi:hypothetical protein